jgi:hypothetical protein
MNAVNKTKLLKDSLSKYNSYDLQTWKQEYFDKFSGGFNVYHKDHQFTSTEGGGEAEKIVGKMLAKLGKQVEFLPENGKGKGVPDLNFDGQTWDIKYINFANEATIRTYIKEARKAENAIFYWKPNIEKTDNLRNAIMREIGRMAKLNRINEMPDIYVIDKNGLLKLLWEKKKGVE